MNTNLVRAVLKANGDAFLTVKFIKKDGSTRVLNGRAGVKKHLAGGVRTSDPSEYFILYEIGNGYRNISKGIALIVFRTYSFFQRFFYRQ